jgi:hypothetical protein
MSSWIIRVDPASADQGFRLADSLADAPKHGGIMALTPIQHDRDLKVDDQVYLWQLGARPGLCATAKVSDQSEERPQPEWQQQFGKPQNYDPKARRALLQIQRYTTEPVVRDFDGSVLWKPNAGTTQRCPSKRCPRETMARFDAIAETFASISSPSAEEYRRLLETAQGRAETDRVVQVLARTEQAYWRKLLFGSSIEGRCAICGRYLPVELLVAAHIKQRSRCSHDERLDPENVMTACLLGCDVLFEKAYIRVDNGTVRINRMDPNSALTDTVTTIANRPVCLGSPGWTLKRAKYFGARQASVQ